MIKKLKFEYLLLIIAILWAIFFSFVLQINIDVNLKYDEPTYMYAAKLLFSEHALDNTRPVLISLIFGLPHLFTSSDYTLIIIGLTINLLSWLLTIVLVFKTLETICTRRISFLLSMIFIFCIGNLAHTFRLLPETIYILLTVLSVYYLSKYYKTDKAFYITLAISVLLLNALIKPVSIGLALILIAFYVFHARRILLNKFSLLLALSLSLLLFQMYSLKKNFGDFTISYISAFAYYNYLGAKADCLRKNIEYIPGENLRTKKFNLLSSHEMKKMAVDDFIDQLKNNKINLLKAYLFCIHSNSSRGNLIVSNCTNKNNTFYFDTFRFIFKAISKLQTIIFTIFGVLLSIFVMIRFKNQKQFYFIIASFILYIFFVSAISCFECDRFHIAFYPLLMLLSSNYLPKKYLVK